MLTSVSSQGNWLHASEMSLLSLRRRLVQEGYSDVLDSLPHVNSLTFGTIPRRHHLDITTPAIAINSSDLLATIDNEMFLCEAKDYFVRIEPVEDHPAKRSLQIPFNWALPSSKIVRIPYPPSPYSEAKTILTLVQYYCVLLVVQRGLNMKLPVPEYDAMTFALRRLRGSDEWQQTYGNDHRGIPPHSDGLRTQTFGAHHAPMLKAQHADISSFVPDPLAETRGIDAVSTHAMRVTQPKVSDNPITSLDNGKRSSQLGPSTEYSGATVQSAEDGPQSNMESHPSETMSAIRLSKTGDTDQANSLASSISRKEKLRAWKAANIPPGPTALEYIQAKISAEMFSRLPGLATTTFEDHKFADGIGIKFVALHLLVGQYGDNASRAPGTKVWAYMKSYVRQNDRIAASMKFMAEVHVNESRTDLHKVTWDNDVLSGDVTLLPFFHGSVTSGDELKAAVKYFFLLAEEAKLFGYDRYCVPANQTFVGLIKKICRQVDMVVTEVNGQGKRIRCVRCTAPRQRSSREESTEEARPSGPAPVIVDQASAQAGASRKRAAPEALVPAAGKRQQTAANRLDSPAIGSISDVSSAPESHHFLPL